jgi:hypothetical protein
MAVSDQKRVQKKINRTEATIRIIATTFAKPMRFLIFSVGPGGCQRVQPSLVIAFSFKRDARKLACEAPEF